MRGFDSSYFSNQFNVSTVHKRSIASLRKSLTTSIQEITQYAPDIVYIHLGTYDIKENRNSDDIMNDYEVIIESILRETSQNCQVVISQVISCKNMTADISNLRSSISKLIQLNVADNHKAVFWKRVSTNPNRNFYSDEKQSQKMFIQDMIHLSERGIRVIMGNFRTSLKSLISDNQATFSRS